MASALQEGISTGLMVTGVAMGAAAISFLAYGLYLSFLQDFLNEAKEQNTSLRGMGSMGLRRLGQLNQRIMWPGYENRMRRQLVRAGEPDDLRPEDIMAMQEIGLVVGVLFGLFFVAATGFNTFWLPVIALVGLFYPMIWVSDQVKKRHLLITRALPYNLDLLTLAVEAGLDFTAALAKVVEKGREGPLRDELQMVLKTLKMGKTREESLKSMVARVDLPSLTTFVGALIQADKMGTSLGKVLRIQSTQLRIDRTQRAEKLANEAPVKMLFPLIACIFPTVFMILFGPIVFAFVYGGVGK